MQVRTFDLVQKNKIFAIGYCFGGGGVLELMRAWPNTPGLLGEAPTANLFLYMGSLYFLRAHALALVSQAYLHGHIAIVLCILTQLSAASYMCWDGALSLNAPPDICWHYKFTSSDCKSSPL